MGVILLRENTNEKDKDNLINTVDKASGGRYFKITKLFYGL